MKDPSKSQPTPSRDARISAELLDDQPVRSLAHKDFTVEGFSRAAVQTYWRIPEMKIGFDLGAQPWSFMGTPTWFVSHTHIDHVVALFAQQQRHSLLRGVAAMVSGDGNSHFTLLSRRGG